MNILSRFKHVYQIGLAFGVFAIAMVGASVIANHTSVKAASSCASINVIYCGLSGSTTSAQISSLKITYYDANTSGHPTPFHDIKTIFAAVGANQSLIDGMTTSNTIAGYVFSSGYVTNTAGRIIGQNARSVGRFYTAHSTLISGTNAYIRPTSDSFADPVIAAIIRLDSSGNMLFGSMISCGNAFTATPVLPLPPPVTPPVVVAPTVTPTVLKPDYTVIKEVAVKGSTSYAPSITVNYGTHVVYRITVTSTGAIPVKSVATNDVLPSGIKYVTGTIAVNGSPTGTTLFSDISVSDGYRIASLDNGSSTVLTFEAIVGPNDTATSCTPGTIYNTATITQKVQQYGVPLLLPKSSTATVNKTCIPPAVTPPPVTPPVTPPPVTPPVTPPPVTPPATPTATATATATAIATATATATTTTTVTPIAVCTNLSLLTSTLNQRLVTATVAYTASSGVALTNVSFNWNDGFLTNNGVATSAQHTYAAIGTYVITSTLSFSNGSTALPQSICQASVTFSAVAPPVITPIVPTVLPNTGPGSTVAIFAGVSAIGTLGYRLFLGRRFAGMIAD